MPNRDNFIPGAMDNEHRAANATDLVDVRKHITWKSKSQSKRYSIDRYHGALQNHSPNWRGRRQVYGRSGADGSAVRHDL
eukprot:CAMPEP_0181486392 /NCGR_PEP_ID=MMETSP1110-20121109/47129_1 /TAXON_ID=174948 /ORGANISM="Symbiodinium sp., Strain CCMP421" /LENGTH=79 /DNA_ID=CAMNT_0023612565 /DNA_START=211 /DNA_END=450 /DNA_ORIENTATION=-